MKVERKMASRETTSVKEAEGIWVDRLDWQSSVANNPPRKPNHVDPNERHRSAESRNAIGNRIREGLPSVGRLFEFRDGADIPLR